MVLKEQYSYLDTFLFNSFTSDRYSRELRLSDDELQYVMEKFPKAIITDLGASDEEKSWYEVTIKK